MISSGETWSNKGEQEEDHIGGIQRDRNEGKPRQTRFVNELYMKQSRGTLISDNRAEKRLSVLINNSELLSTPLILSIKI